jgi:hypothetical protein
MANPFAKTRDQATPYAIYKQGDYEYRVLKTYKMPKTEAKDIYARWFLATKGPHSMGFELGDGYAKDIRDNSELILADTDWLDHYT